MANLYDKAGLVNIPVGYQDGFLYNIKPEDNTLGFRFNRDSAATRVNKEGLIEQVGYFGPELVQNGNFSDGTNDWETEGFSSITVGDYEGRTDVANINISNNATISRIRQPFNYVNGKKYKVSVDVFVVSGSFRIDCSDSFVSGDFVSTTTTGSWLTLTSEIEAISTGTNYIWLRGLLEVSQFYVSNISVQEILGDKPRIDYTDSLTSPSFLLEPQSTNLITFSEDFSNSSWIKNSTGTGTNPTLDFGYISPDGSVNATKITFNIGAGSSASDLCLFKTNISAINGVATIYLKGNTGGEDISFLAGNTRENIILTNSWKRYTLSSTSLSQLVLRLRGDQSTNKSCTIYVWGAQVEQLSYPTSYIPTAGSTVTRAEETCIGAGNASTFNDSEGVLYAEIAALANDGTSRRISISAGNTNNNNLVSLIYGISNRISPSIYSGGSFQMGGDYTLPDQTETIKVALKYSTNDAALWVNGLEVLTDTSVTTPVGLDQIKFEYGNGSNKFYGKTKGVYVFNEALTDDELQQLTGPEYNSFAALAAAYNYTVI